VIPDARKDAKKALGSNLSLNREWSSTHTTHRNSDTSNGQKSAPRFKYFRMVIVSDV
jgi:hypothetical protein